MGAGVVGLGPLIARVPALGLAAALGGAAYLVWHGLRALRSAIRPAVLEPAAAPAAGRGGWAVAVSAASISLLNPHAYLDTAVLFGGLAAGHPPEGRALFGLGAVLASGVWYLGLALGAAPLAPLLRRPAAWRALDVLVGLVMWGVAASLLRAAILGRT